MNPYAEAQLAALIEGIRLLEVYVTAPLGLYSDIRMLRESLDVAAAADLSRENAARLRQLHAALTDDRASLALDAIESARRVCGDAGGHPGRSAIGYVLAAVSAGAG